MNGDGDEMANVIVHVQLLEWNLEFAVCYQF